MELLKDKEKYNGDIIEDANKYYNENVNGIYEDSKVEKVGDSKMVTKGSKWLYLEEDVEVKKEVINEEKVVVKKLEYKAKKFKDKEAANKWLEKNEDWAVIKTKNGEVFVAKKSDKGKKIEESVELSENVKSANTWL